MRRTVVSKHWVNVIAGLIFLGGAARAEQAPAWARPAEPEPRVRARVLASYGQVPLAFEENRGQSDPRVRFLVRGSGFGLFLKPTEAVLSLRLGDAGHAVHLALLGTDPAPRVTGEERSPGEVNDLRGQDRGAWHTHIPLFSRVRYAGIYPGVDLVYYGRERQLEHDFIVAPGANAEKIRFAVAGADRVEIDGAGDLVLHLGSGEARLKRPVAYQGIGGTKREVASRYRLLGKEGTAPQVGFTVAAYDRTRPLVIDPVLVYSVSLPTATAKSIAADPAGNAYVTGWTDSADFPATLHFNPFFHNADAFVAKLDPKGTLVYAAVFGGSYYDSGEGIAVDPQGNVYVTGQTFSGDFPYGTFPFPPNPDHTLPPPFFIDSGVAFAAKLDASGSSLVYGEILSHDPFGRGTDVAADSHGNAYVIGIAGDEHHTFLRKIGPTGLAGFASASSNCPISGGPDYLTAVAVDADDNAYLAGYTNSFDAFVVKLAPSGQTVYSTCLPGNRADFAFGVTADRAGNAYVTGSSNSTDFPTLHPPPQTGRGTAFLSKISPRGAIVYSTRLGGSGQEYGIGLGTDARGAVFVSGQTTSADFPVVKPLPSGCQPGPQHTCTFLMKLNPRGTKIRYSTFVGNGDSSNLDTFLFTALLSGPRLATDPAGDAYLTSPIFAVKIADRESPDCIAATASPRTIWPPDHKLVPVSIRLKGQEDEDDDETTILITAITQDEPPTGLNPPDATGLGIATAKVRAERADGGDGRVYHLSFTATDEDGGSCTGAVTVCVPHDQGGGRTCGDGGALYSSTGSGR